MSAETLRLLLADPDPAARDVAADLCMSVGCALPDTDALPAWLRRWYSVSGSRSGSGSGSGSRSFSGSGSGSFSRSFSSSFSLSGSLSRSGSVNR